MAAASHEIAMPEVLFRPMLPDDVGAVAALEAQVYEFPWSEGIFRDCLRVGYDCRAVDIGDQLLAGYGILSTGAGEAHILNVCVRPDLRCLGIGRRLLEFLLECAHVAGAENAFLEVRISNLSAIRLYQTVGFEQIGIRRGYYQSTNDAAGQGREDAMVFKLHLPAWLQAHQA